MSRRPIYLGALLSGVVLIAFAAYRGAGPLHAITEELQGNCDFFPCAYAGTYLLLALYVAVAAIGVVIAVLAVRALTRHD